MYLCGSVLLHSSICVVVNICVPVLTYSRMLEGSCINTFVNLITFQGYRLHNQKYCVSEGKQHCRPASKLLRDWFCSSRFGKGLSRAIGK